MPSRAEYQKRGRAALTGALVLFVLAQFVGGLLLDRYGLVVRFPSAAHALGGVPKGSGPDLVFLGSSRFMGIHSGETAALLQHACVGGRPPVVCNLSVPAGDPITEEFMLNRLLEKGARPRLVVVEVWPDFLNLRNDNFSLHPHRQMCWGDVPTYLVDVARANQLNRLAASRLVPLFAHRRELRQQSLNALAYLESPVAACADTPSPVDSHRIPENLGSFAGSAIGLVPPETPPLTPEQERSFDEGSKGAQRRFRNYQATGNTVTALERLLGRCREQGIDVLLVAAPTLSYWRRNYTPEVESSYRACIDRLTRTYGCSYVDYRDRLPDRYFADCLHLNGPGFVYFNQLLTQEKLKAYWQTYTPGGETALHHAGSNNN